MTPIFTPTLTGSYNWGMAETYSYVPIANEHSRPIFAKVVLPVGDIGQKQPMSGYDRIELIPPSQPTQIRFYIQSTITATLSIVYDEYGNVSNIYRL